jgi:LacI family transcriptional regulator
MKNVSIRDIAGKVGVSTTTVSFVLNGKAKEKRISDELRDRILETARSMNYRPNQIARGLRTGQTHTFGLILEDISNPFFAHLARFVEDFADRSGYKVMFSSTENNDEKATSLIYLFLHRQMDGFIIIPTPGIEKEIASLAGDHRPVVLVDRFFPGLANFSVTVNNYKGARDGIDLMIRKGYRKIGLVTLDSEQMQMQERVRGYREALVGHGLDCADAAVLKIPYDMPHETIVERIKAFLKKEKHLTGLFFTTNYLGVAGLEAIRNLGKKIPQDIAVVSFDDNDLFRLGSPTVTVIAQPIREIGEKAVELLLRQINDKHSEPVQLVLDAMIIERESV